MRRLRSEHIRLVKLGREDDPANVARLVRSAIAAPLDPVPHLKARIRRSLRRRSAWRRRHLRVAILGSVVFLTGGLVGAVAQPILHLWQQRKTEPVANISPVPPAPRTQHRRVPPQLARLVDEADEAPLLPPEPSAPPPQADSASTRNEALPARAPIARAAPATEPFPAGPSARSAVAVAPTGGSPLRTAMLEPPPTQPEPRLPPAAPSIPAVASAAQGAVTSSPSEQALLSSAVRSLRSEHRPGSALAVLDEYVNQFPGGSLLPEATRLRTEALLALGQKRAALAELNQASASGAAGSEESHLVRGELRAAAGRWREALQDFEVVVHGRLAYEAASGISTSAKLRERFERALWDRASARSHLGDDAGARADLRECWRRFPDGRFAARVAQLLGELP